ncbi:MAG: hypothetical protein AAGH40_10155 [Verrucomicrobiota bacterium]
MDNIFEIIVPLIIAAVYFFGNMMSGKQQDDEAPPAPPAKRNRRQTGTEDPGAEARQREIQEAIRRKIMERRAAASEEEDGGVQTAPPVIPTARDPRERRRRMMEAREERKQAKRAEQASPETPPELPKPVSNQTPQPAAFSWDESDNVYASGMEAQLARIEETKRRAEAIKAKARSAQRSQPERAQTSKGGRYFSGPVRSTLRNPSAARAAIIYSEVLGQPIGLRKGNSSVPGLSLQN